ncbi:hypothetical protein PInf_016664 [Phytophthora infestans]|nr:hypothetical protein PInf_016664 [Phytophthora infestans]
MMLLRVSHHSRQGRIVRITASLVSHSGHFCTKPATKMLRESSALCLPRSKHWVVSLLECSLRLRFAANDACVKSFKKIAVSLR